MTIDSQFETFNEKVASQLLTEIATLANKYNFVLVHGAGSFGHYHAKEYDLKNGLKNSKIGYEYLIISSGSETNFFMALKDDAPAQAF